MRGGKGREEGSEGRGRRVVREEKREERGMKGNEGIGVRGGEGK